MVRFLWLLVCLAFGMTGVAPASAASRLALVIGINDYQHVPKLQKAVADAQAMANVLKSLGYEVTQLINPARRDLYAGVSAVTGKLQPGDTIVLHFSGHGVQIDNENYLLPADIPSPAASDKEFLKSEAIAVSTLVERFRTAGVRVQILVIDACRDNPFAGAGTRSVGATRGLGPQAAPPKGTFILFSAGQGQSALDALDDADREPNSPFTRMLLKKMTVEGKSLTDLARELRDDVEQAANLAHHEQRPAYYDELSGAPFYFVAPKSAGGSAQSLVPDPAPPSRDLAAELAFWDYVKGAGNAELFDAYLAKFGDKGLFSAIAQVESARLKQAKLAALPPTPPLLPPPIYVAPPPPAKTADEPDPRQAPRPGFNCALAASGVEIAICASVGLADKDRAMGVLYRQTQAFASGQELADLYDSQREWRHHRDACGLLAPGDAVSGCIGRSYDSRILQLRQILPPTSVPGSASAAVPLRTRPTAPQEVCRLHGTSSQSGDIYCASSALAAQSGTSYSVENLFGSQPGAWVANTRGYAIDEWVNIEMPNAREISKFVIYNGYQKSPDLYYQNSRVKNLDVVLSSGEIFHFVVEDSLGSQVFSFPKAIKTNWVHFVIKGVYPGEKYTDTALSRLYIR